MNELGYLFNKYEHVFVGLTEPTRQLADVTVAIRFRLFGDQQQMVGAWNAEHPDDPKTGIYWMCLSSNPIEIWGVVRKEGQYGAMVVNHLSLGHEVNHALRVALSEWTLNSEDPENDGSAMLSPDRYIDI